MSFMKYRIGEHWAVICCGWSLVILAAGCDLPDLGARRVASSVRPDRDGADLVRKALDMRAGAAAGVADASSLGEPTGWATFKGVFKVAGSAPNRTPLSITKDVEVCAPGGRTVLDESVVVSPNGGLGNVLIYLATPIPQDDARWEHESYSATKTADVLFDQKECIFLSHVFAMRATQRMRVKNSDPVGHNTNLDSKRGALAGNFTVAANGEAFYEPKFASPTAFPVTCSIHPWMKAWAMVSDNPYFAVTSAEGEFEIPNVPAGVPLEFRVWHEKATLQKVTVGGQAADWPKGKLALKFDPDETKNLEVSVDAAIFQ